MEATTSSTRVLTIPNILTVSRMIASPFIGYWIIQEEFALAMGWFLAASATDAVDGFIAKRFNQKSVVGSFLDPLADKLLMTIMVTTMAYKALLPLPLVGLILLRDVSLLAGGVIRRYRSLPRPVTVSRFFSVSKVESIEIKPTVISKVNTVLQVGLVFLVLSAKGLDFTLDPMFMSGLEWSVAGTTLFSGLDYLNSNAMQRIKTFQDRLTKRDP